MNSVFAYTSDPKTQEGELQVEKKQTSEKYGCIFAFVAGLRLLGSEYSARIS
jgi:hypothetical protein